MRTLVCLAAAATLWTGAAGAVHTEHYEIPYFGVGVQQLITDGARESDDGQGLQFTVGVPLRSGVGAIELRWFDTGYERFDGKKDYQNGLVADYVRDFGPMGGPGAEGLLRGIKPFVVVGVGFIKEDVRGDSHLHFGANAGAGLLIPLGFSGWAARFDARAQAQSNNESVPTVDSLVDYQVNLGLQIPMSLFFDKPVTMKPIADCPIAVVDPETGRRDCAADSDSDGVGDTLDGCPGTPAGTAVDRHGCPQTRVSNDSDGDGVPNAQDDCPGTSAGLQVDRRGCVVAQNTSLRGVTFQPNSARLTAEGRQTLDGVAATLQEQEDLKLEIAGHTDAIGSEAYNTLLSQQRAEAVLAYLVEKGISQERMTAVGYGELEPVDSNDTDEGRRANRRVEFRITTD